MHDGNLLFCKNYGEFSHKVNAFRALKAGFLKPGNFLRHRTFPVKLKSAVKFFFWKPGIFYALNPVFFGFCVQCVIFTAELVVVQKSSAFRKGIVYAFKKGFFLFMLQMMNWKGWKNKVWRSFRQFFWVVWNFILYAWNISLPPPKKNSVPPPSDSPQLFLYFSTFLTGRTYFQKRLVSW